MNKPKRIFTFWEPKDKIPPYLQLCMETWKKFLPEYEIIILDYDSLDKWLGKNYFSKDLFLSYSLPKQADAIRCALLKKYNGIWMDCDTIITSNKIREFLDIKAEVIMIDFHIGFIIVNKKKSFVMKNWDIEIKKCMTWNILYRYFKFAHKLIDKFFPDLSYHIKEHHWIYLGNYALKDVFKKTNLKQFYSINREKNKLLPEINHAKENGLEADIITNYRNFYFKRELSDYALDGNNGIINLHNSWTPNEYKKMSKEEFLKQNCTLANILKKVL